MNLKTSTLTSVICMLAYIPASAQCELYEFNTNSDPAVRNFTISCGSVNSAQWDVSNDSCGMKTDAVVMPGDSTLQYTTPVSIRINGSGNLECDDIILISYFIDTIRYQVDTIRGCDFNRVFNTAFNITCYGQQIISVAISLINDDKNEKLQIKDGNMCIGTAVPVIPVPVLWSYFEANAYPGLVQLNWKTTVEIENDMFTLQRSMDGQTFDDIGYVGGAGNSATPVAYSFEDEKPVQGYTYYRIKQTNYDGESDYSSVIAVNYQKSWSSDFDLYPNPVRSDQVYMSFEDLPREEFLVALYDPLGRILFSNVVLTGDEESDYAIAIDKEVQLAPGVYLVVGSSHSRLFQKRLVIQIHQDIVTLHIMASSR